MLSSAVDENTIRQGYVYLTSSNPTSQERGSDRLETTLPASTLSCEDLYGEIVHPYTEYISTGTQGSEEGFYVHPVCSDLSYLLTHLPLI